MTNFPRVYTTNAFAWTLRPSDHSVDTSAKRGAPLSICSLAGDWRAWHESTPHEFKPFPIRGWDAPGSATRAHDGSQNTIWAKPEPPPLRVSSDKLGYENLFLNSKCTICGRCDPRVTNHWLRYQPASASHEENFTGGE